MNGIPRFVRQRKTHSPKNILKLWKSREIKVIHCISREKKPHT
jgi:hypothetical protein